MCGIAGIIKWKDAPASSPYALETTRSAALSAMSAALAQRGPDGAGQWIDPRPGHTAALLHRRLAVIDLPGGHQPMANEDGSVQLVFNGEIYNHAELRAELISLGHTFRSNHSDTEVLVHGWEQWAFDLPRHLVGMFAFAAYDTRSDMLFLARDRMGQKPLFYSLLDDGIVFASTIPAVLAWPEVPRRVPREHIALYLQMGYLPPPQTIYRDISQLLPGHYLSMHRDVVTGKDYWESKVFCRDPKVHYEPRPTPQVRTELRQCITQAVQSQMAADVPLACFLSGGIDSSIIATLLQQAVKAAGGAPITTVSVGFREAGFDETQYAQIVAARIGSRHVRLEVNPHQDVPGTLTRLMDQTLGQPFADSSLLPTHHLSRAVRGMATVALSGDGADELFAGYDRYLAAEMLPQYATLLRFMPAALPLGSLATRERWRRFASAAHATSLSNGYTALVGIFSHELLAALLQQDFDDFAPEPALLGAPAHISPLRLAMLRDQREYLPGDVLWKVDSAAMACALEVRSPFLDHRVVDAANQLWEKQLIGSRMGKFILRETFEDLLPEEVRTRGKKGFGVPIGEWFKTDLRNFLQDTLSAAGAFCSTHLDRKVIQRLLEEHASGQRDHTHRLFALVMLELWWRSAGATLE